ncbi:HAD family hydrolase [Paenibacillus sp. TRM 82003]|nr:HAD family hydrolase [Paenibacillus sp. TRM 82003]
MKDIRLVVSDLDGTLLSPDHKVSRSVITSIRKYVREGGLFTIATGRPLYTARSVIDQIGIDIPVILCNGAVLAAGGHVLERSMLRAVKVADLLSHAHAAGLNVLLFRESGIEVFDRNAEIDAFEHKESVVCKVVEPESKEWRGGELEKAILLGDMHQVKAVLEHWKSVLDTDISVFQSEPNYVEVVSGGVNKGTALLRLSVMLGVRPEQIMAIGNQMNDLPMLRQAGIGVAVANSPDELKKNADYVCHTSYGGGVVEAIEQLVYGGNERCEFQA